MDNDKRNQLAQNVSRGTLAGKTLDFFSEHLDKLSEAVDKRIFKKMNSSETLDMNDLLQAYSEKNAYNNIKSTLKDAQKIGESSGKKLKPEMEKKDGNKGRKHAKSSFSTYRG